MPHLPYKSKNLNFRDMSIHDLKSILSNYAGFFMGWASGIDWLQFTVTIGTVVFTLYGISNRRLDRKLIKKKLKNYDGNRKNEETNS